MYMEYLNGIAARESRKLKEKGIGGNSTQILESANLEMRVNKLRKACPLSGVPNISSQKQYHLKFWTSIFPVSLSCHCRLVTMYSRYRYSSPFTGLDRPWGFQKVEAPRFQYKRHMKVVRLSALAPAAFTPQEIFLALISVEAESIPGPQCCGAERLCQWKIPMTPSRIEPATFRLVAQCPLPHHNIHHTIHQLFYAL